jgi:hypothetical protein
MLRARWTIHNGIGRIAAALIGASLLLIPVRCDASPFPHSIFIDPPSPEHAEHHAAGNQRAGHIQAIPSKEDSPSSEHLAGMAMSTDDGGARTADPGSIQTGASMIDAPYSISLAAQLALSLGEGQRLHRPFPMPDAPRGASIAPPSPPPKIAG